MRNKRRQNNKGIVSLMVITVLFISVFSVTVFAETSIGEDVTVQKQYAEEMPDASGGVPEELTEEELQKEELPEEAVLECAGSQDSSPEIALLEEQEEITDSQTRVASNKAGIYKTAGAYRYYENGQFTPKTGLARRVSDGKWLYVEKGIFSRATGLARRISDGKWMYVRNGFFKRITGVVRRMKDKKLLYVEKGIYKRVTGIVKRVSDGKYVYVKNGFFNRSTGIAKRRSDGKWLYLKNGVFKISSGYSTKIGDDRWVLYYKNGVRVQPSRSFSGVFHGKCYKNNRRVKAFYMQDWIDFLDDASGADALKIKNAEIKGAKLDQLKAAMKKYSSVTKTYGFIAVNTKTGLTVSYNADKSLFGASTIKAPYIAALCKYNAKGINRWKNEIYQTLYYSNNDTYDDLFCWYGKSPVYRLMKEANVRASIGKYGYRYSSARDLAKMWCVMKDYLDSDAENVLLLKNNLLYHKQNGKFSDYYKKGWMDPYEWSGGILNCGGAGDNWVYGIVSGYSGRMPESEQDALIAAIKKAIDQ